MVTRLDETLAALHPAQRLAVTHPARPLLLACGPGSGKTRILTHRIQWLFEREGLDPTAILALTFSRAAADELRGRLVTALGPRARTLSREHEDNAASRMFPASVRDLRVLRTTAGTNWRGCSLRRS